MTGLVAFVMVLSACAPAPLVGHVLHGPQRPGKVVLAAHGGGGVVIGAKDEGGIGRGAGGVLHVEPFATSRLSVPISIGAAGLWHARLAMLEELERMDGYASGRAGLRYRVGRRYTFGGGVGGGMVWGKTYDEERLADGSEARVARALTDGSAHLDFEWSQGRRIGDVRITFAQRLVWDVRNLVVFHLVSEIGVAWYPTGQTVALTAAGYVGWTLPFPLWGGLTAGIALEL